MRAYRSCESTRWFRCRVIISSVAGPSTVYSRTHTVFLIGNLWTSRRITPFRAEDTEVSFYWWRGYAIRCYVTVRLRFKRDFTVTTLADLSGRADRIALRAFRFAFHELVNWVSVDGVGWSAWKTAHPRLSGCKIIRVEMSIDECSANGTRASDIRKFHRLSNRWYISV